MSQKKFYVYEYWDNILNEPFYVGKGSGNRSTEHLKDALRKTAYTGNKHKLNRIKKLLESDAVEVRIVFSSDDEDAAYNEETKLINKYGRRDIGSGSLTNLNNGGTGGGKNPSAEVREKIGSAMRGKTHTTEARAKISDASSKKRHTSETKSKMSKSHTGKTVSDETRRKMSEARKGRKPWNKGLKTGIVTDGAFKKGHVPHNKRNS